MSETVTLTSDFDVAPEGHTTYHYSEGEEVSGLVAELALKAGAARKPKRTPGPKHTKPDTPDEEG